MRRPKTPDSQLSIEWTETMRWEDLPAPLRERVREQLGKLLRQAASGAAWGPEASHEDE